MLKKLEKNRKKDKQRRRRQLVVREYKIDNIKKNIENMTAI